MSPSRETTLRLGSISGDPAASRKVRWSRDYALIPGATAATYRLTAADLGHRIRAVVYLDRRGYKQMVVPTGFTRVVKATPVLRVATTRGTSGWPCGPPFEPPGCRTSTAPSRSALPASSSARFLCATALPPPP